MVSPAGCGTRVRWRACSRENWDENESNQWWMRPGQALLLVLDGVQDPHNRARACAVPPRPASLRW